MKGSPVILDTIVTDFKALAAKIGPSFRVRDAEAAGHGVAIRAELQG